MLGVSTFSYCTSTSLTPPIRVPPRRTIPIRAAVQAQEIRVCTNRTCRRQGSMQILDTLSGLAPPDVSVKPCGCLGRCGSGPNLALLPDGLVVAHCATAARAAEILLRLRCGDEADDVDAHSRPSLEALALRKRAEAEIDKGNFSEAELLLSQALDLKPFGGTHVIYKSRSIARLGMGNHSGALEDATESLKLAPKFAEAYICQGDAFLAMDQFDAAGKSYSTCLQIEPSLCRSKSFKARIANLQEKLTSANIP
ncbi:hypothetical protein SLA2020_289920 [Shorea laevis]